jgi:hypothetical protein
MRSKTVKRFKYTDQHYTNDVKSCLENDFMCHSKIYQLHGSNKLIKNETILGQLNLHESVMLWCWQEWASSQVAGRVWNPA